MNPKGFLGGSQIGVVVFECVYFYTDLICFVIIGKILVPLKKVP